MATATVARPAQALRQRRDPPRPSVPPKRTAGMDNATEPPGKRRRLDEPHVITRDHILRKFAGKPPSLILHLHPNFFRFESQDGSWPYDSPMKFVLDDIRKERVPHELLEELLLNDVPFYDDCLIVEIHNHRAATGKSKREDAASNSTRSSMHNYSVYVTPSPYVDYPRLAQQQAVEKVENEKAPAGEDKGKQQNGPQIATVVLFPTEMTRHREMLLLAKTPASQMPRKRKGGDEPPTPQLSVPPTPMAATAGRSTPDDNKMCLEPQDFYQFQADVLLATQPPLLLQPVDGPESTQKVLEALSHPLHQASPPSPKTRKRTTAEMAADDEKAAEAERRMLVMDERIKAGANAGAAENTGTAATMGFSRFKTIQVVREKLEQAEREKKEKEHQEQARKRQAEEEAQRQAKAQQEAAEQHQQMLKQRQAAAMMKQRQMQQQHAYQQAHGHPQQNMLAQQQAMHAASMAQASPVVRQQTPMMNSSPMMPANGFPMQPTTSQGAGSPPRPTSATMSNANAAMQRQVSQQQHPSRNATPQMPQATPNMGGMPNRQMSQTPRIAQGSPAPGTPAANAMGGLPMQTPAGMTQEQFAMLQHQRMVNQHNANAMQSASPGQHATQSMTPEQIQNIAQRQSMQMRQQALMQQAQGNPQMAQALAQRQAMMMRQQQAQMIQQQRMQMQQQHGQAGQNSNAHPGMQANAQMNHGHPQQGDGNQAQMTAQQLQHRQQLQQQQFRQAQSVLTRLQQQYGSLGQIPGHVIAQLPQAAQMLLKSTQQRQNAAQAQQMAARAQHASQHGQAVVGTSGGDPEYMQTLRAHQEMLRQQQAGMGGNMNMNMGMNMGMNMANQQFNNQQGNNADLSQQFQAMQRALAQNGQNGQM
ncbi:hypothetical protein CBER1_08756 [Cercospora berteroae]|uniref:Spt20-like SEP domain-containing protein n=1 Tax=Cercospora berteroae TaxID=357750 RepID=A0A2S6BW51_9PEZI|nr:hypothetical protein CBER1_08756 [Cercospora berteroae]